MCMNLKKKLKGIKLYTWLGIGGVCMLGVLYSVNSIKDAGEKLADMSQARDRLEENINSEISKNYALSDNDLSKSDTHEVMDNMSKSIDEAKNDKLDKQKELLIFAVMQ